MTTEAAAALAFRIHERFVEYRRRFDSITLRARPRFEGRDWRAFERDIVERIDVYESTVAAALAEVRTDLGNAAHERHLWNDAREVFARLITTRDDPQLAATYFNSVTRRVFATTGVDAAIEFLGEPAMPPPGEGGLIEQIELTGGPDAVIDTLVRHRRFQATWADRHRDITAGGAALGRALAEHGITGGVVEVLVPTFYRGHGAYVVGRVCAGDRVLPLALAIHHDRTGLYLGAVLTSSDDLSVLFSYTHREFMVRTPDPGAMIAFISSLVPHRRVSELYTAIGLRKHGKTELFRDLWSHVTTTPDHFVRAPGIPGLVMIVFTLDQYDMVFKVIRDHFPPQKSVTPPEVREKYAIVSRHDRAGRLIDAQEFRGLSFPADRFDEALLDELLTEAARTVQLVGTEVRIDRAYIERQVVPLDVFLRDAAPDAAAGAIVEYGTAIKNLAATNVFPGDMLIKNFGVTRRGRVVFYDYDELSLLTDCNFRKLPVAEHPHDEMAETPWFGVGGGDIFPEEFRSFLGVGPELRAVFEDRHGDLYDVDFWHRVQERIRRGETIEVFPYRRSAAL